MQLRYIYIYTHCSLFERNQNALKSFLAFQLFAVFLSWDVTWYAGALLGAAIRMSFWGWRPNMWPVKSVHQGALNDRSGSACCIFNMQSRHVISRDLDVAESHCKPHIDCLVRLLAWGKNNLKQPVGFRCLDNSSSFFGGMIYHLILKQLLNEYSNKLCC